MKLVCVFLLFALAACTIVIPTEERDVHMFDLVVKPVAGTDGTQLEVSGSSRQSALVVTDVSVATRGDTMVMHVDLALAGSLHGHSGNFTRMITVPPEVRRLAFGDENTVIWERGS